MIQEKRKETLKDFYFSNWLDTNSSIYSSHGNILYS